MATDRLLSALDALQEVDSQLPLTYAVVFLEVAMNEGATLAEIGERTGMERSTVSRIVGALADKRQNHAPAYGLVETRRAPHDSRYKTVQLTERGCAKFERLSGIMHNS